MDRVRLSGPPQGVPGEFLPRAAGAAVFDCSSSPEARVYYVDAEPGFYLKTGAPGALRREAAMTEYFFGKGLGAEVLGYVSGERDWLCTAAVPGEDCRSVRYLADPKRLCDTLAQVLRSLHETAPSHCPVMDRTAEYLAGAERNYRRGTFDPRFGYASAEAAHAALTAGKSTLERRVLIHGDACLPNILLRDWRFSGFIDLDCAGVGDRHIDLYWALWSLERNLKTDQYRDRFLDAYGRDMVDLSRLEIVAAAEAFG